MIGRLFSTLLAFVIYAGIAAYYAPVATIMNGDVAGRQFDDSNIAAVTASAVFRASTLFWSLLSLALLVALFRRCCGQDRGLYHFTQ